MKVFEIMTIDVGFCFLDDDLTRAAEIMWHKDCGIVPIVDAGKCVAGVVTDRDIAIAAATRNQKTSAIKAREMIFREPVTCAMEDDVKDVLQKMQNERIKRLPVTGEQGELLGIISFTDIVSKAAGKKAIKKLVFSTLRILAESPARVTT